jgi:hypothetical protein
MASIPNGESSVSDPIGEPLPGVSVQDAAATMGVSVSTMRQWCASGRVRTQQVTHNAVHTIRVLLDQRDDPGPKPNQPVSVAGVVPPISTTSPERAVNDTQDEISLESSPDDQLAVADQNSASTTLALVARTASQFMAPFAAELTATRELSERQAVQLRDQAELIGRLSSDLDRARTIVEELRSSEAQSRDLTHRVTWALVVLGIVIVAAMSAALAWWFGH